MPGTLRVSYRPGVFGSLSASIISGRGATALVLLTSTYTKSPTARFNVDSFHRRFLDDGRGRAIADINHSNDGRPVRRLAAKPKVVGAISTHEIRSANSGDHGEPVTMEELSDWQPFYIDSRCHRQMIRRPGIDDHHVGISEHVCIIGVEFNNVAFVDAGNLHIRLRMASVIRCPVKHHASGIELEIPSRLPEEILVARERVVDKELGVVRQTSKGWQMVARGASTTTLTSALSRPSTVYVNLSVPTKPARGRYTIECPSLATVATPPADVEVTAVIWPGPDTFAAKQVVHQHRKRLRAVGGVDTEYVIAHPGG